MEYTGKAVLKDGRTLHLREARRGDAETLLAFTRQVGGESDYLVYGPEGVGLTLPQEQAFVEACRQNPDQCMLTGWLEDKMVGLCSVAAPPQPRLAHKGDVGIAVVGSHWGLGIGEAMLRTVIDIAREEMALHLVHLGVRADNTRAAALYKKLGFVEYGRFPHFFCVDGEFYDELEMALMLTPEGGAWP